MFNIPIQNVERLNQVRETLYFFNQVREKRILPECQEIFYFFALKSEKSFLRKQYEPCSKIVPSCSYEQFDWWNSYFTPSSHNVIKTNLAQSVSQMNIAGFNQSLLFSFHYHFHFIEQGLHCTYSPTNKLTLLYFIRNGPGSIHTVDNIRFISLVIFNIQ